MEALSILCVEVVESTKELDQSYIMTHKMKFRDIEVGPDPQVDEDLLVVMETAKHIFKVAESVIGVDRILC